MDNSNNSNSNSNSNSDGNNNKEYDYLIKIGFVGDFNCNDLINNYCAGGNKEIDWNSSKPKSYFLDFSLKNITIENKVIRILLYEIPRDYEFRRSLTTNYYKMGHSFIIVYNSSHLNNKNCRESHDEFSEIQYWLNEIEKNTQNDIISIPKALISITSSLEANPLSQINSFSNGSLKEEFSEFINMKFYQISIKDSQYMNNKKIETIIEAIVKESIVYLDDINNSSYKINNNKSNNRSNSKNKNEMDQIKNICKIS